jgi:hypothetical protein
MFQGWNTPMEFTIDAASPEQGPEPEGDAELRFSVVDYS